MWDESPLLIIVNTIVKNHTGSCDIEFKGDFQQYCENYLKVAMTCIDRDLSDECMVIGTSAVIDTELEYAGGIYSGIFNIHQVLFEYFIPVSSHPDGW